MSADYSAVPADDLRDILHEIEVTIRQGAYYKKVHVGGGVWFQVSALASDEVYDVYGTGRDLSPEEQTMEIFTTAVKGVHVGAEVITPTRPELIDLWDSLVGMNLDYRFISLYHKVFSIFQDLHNFVPTFCDTHNSQMLYAWYEHNAQGRKFHGQNSLESIWVWMMKRYDQDVAFENAKFIASGWSKNAHKTKSLVTEGLSWYHKYYNVKSKDPNFMSVADMEAMMERSRRGEKDAHDLAVEETERNQRQAILDLLEQHKARAADVANRPLPDEYTTF